MIWLPDALILPSPIQQRLECLVGSFLRPDFLPTTDFATPLGEEALVDPDSVSWQIFKNPLALFIGGVAAVILELAEPRVGAGVWEHTTFRHNPLQRLQRTGCAAMMTVYGPRSSALAMIARVGKLHGRISGVTPDGQTYRADDPELLTWVHATASFGFLEAYHAYVQPLDAEARNRFYADGCTSARLYGASAAPTSQRELDMLFASTRGKLQPSPIIFGFLEIMRRIPLLPRSLASMQNLLIDAAIELIPAEIRNHLGLAGCGHLQHWQRHAIRYCGAAADRILLQSGPAVQSCRRLNLPDDYLYRRRTP